MRRHILILWLSLSLYLLTSCVQLAKEKSVFVHNVLEPQQEEISEVGTVPYACAPAFMADGLRYQYAGPAIAVCRLCADYCDGVITARVPVYPENDGESNCVSAGTPYLKMNGGAWLLMNEQWCFFKHDGPQLDIPDETDVLGHPLRGQRPAWLLFLLEHTPDPPCAREDIGYKQPPVCAPP